MSDYSFTVRATDDAGRIAVTPQRVRVGTVKALLHFDGADGATTFTDQTGRVWSRTGNAQLDTAKSKFGASSLLLDGAGDQINTAASADFTPSDDFTAECFFYINSFGTKDLLYLLSTRATSGATFSNQWSMVATSLNKLSFVWWANDGTGFNITGSGTGVVTGVWHHAAFCRAGDDLLVFLNGTQVGYMNMADQQFDDVAGSLFRVGMGAQNPAGGTRDFNGWIDEVRVVKGAALYRGDFTVPTAAFPNP